MLRDTVLVFNRAMRLSLRNPAWVIIGLVALGLLIYIVAYSVGCSSASASSPSGAAA